jgi:hypothetical protein
VLVVGSMVTWILHLILCIGFNGLSLLARSVANNFHLRFYLSFRSMCVYHNFYLHFFLLSPFDKAWSRILMYIDLVILMWVVQWLLALSRGPNRSVSRTYLRMETHPVSETLCSLVFRILDVGQSPSSSEPFRIYMKTFPIYTYRF